MLKKPSLSKSGSSKDLSAKSKSPVLPLILLAVVIIVGTVGYYLMWLDDYNATIIDSLFMTLTTITTIGFGEVKPLDDTARIFTILIAFFGIGSLFYVLGVWMENLFMIQLNNNSRRKKTMKIIDKLNNHIILIGYGRVGQLAANELKQSNEDFIIIDASIVDNDVRGIDDSMLTLRGDATYDDVLIRAGIRRAKGLIISTPDSATNVFIVLSAKVLNPGIFIVARSDYENDVEKLRRAGADRIVNPYSIGGVRMANMMLNTNIIDFLETSYGEGEENLKMENLTITNNNPWVNMSLRDTMVRQKTGVTILAVIRNGKPLVNPGGDFIIRSGDQLAVFGTRSQLLNLEKAWD